MLLKVLQTKTTFKPQERERRFKPPTQEPDIDTFGYELDEGLMRDIQSAPSDDTKLEETNSNASLINYILGQENGPKKSTEELRYDYDCLNNLGNSSITFQQYVRLNIFLSEYICNTPIDISVDVLEWSKLQNFSPSYNCDLETKKQSLEEAKDFLIFKNSNIAFFHLTYSMTINCWNLSKDNESIHNLYPKWLDDYIKLEYDQLWDGRENENSRRR